VVDLRKAVVAGSRPLEDLADVSKTLPLIPAAAAWLVLGD